MKNIKATFFDIDGTLVPFGYKTIPEYNKSTLLRLKDAGVKIFISSGRHPEWIVNVDGVNFDGYVTANGALCVLDDRKTPVYQRTIDNEDFKKLVEFEKSHSFPFVVVPAEGGIFISRKSEIVEKASEKLHTPPIPVRPLECAIGRDIVQLMVFGTQEEIAGSGMFNVALNHCRPTGWNPYFADITPIGSNKAAGIEAMCRYFGIDMAETIAFGDGGNDIEMLKAVGTGVAMGNASPDVKDIADYITDDCDKNGIEKSLIHFGLLKSIN